MSREKIGKLAVEIEGDASGLSQGFKEAEKTTGGFADKFHRFATRASDGLDEFIDKSKKSFGKRSAFGEAVEFFTRGAQVFAINEIGSKFAEFTGSLAGIAEGKKSAVELMSEMGKSLPVVGGFVSGWTNIFDLVDGTAGRMKDLNEANRLAEEKQGTFDALRGAGLAHQLAFAPTSAERNRLAIEAKRIADQKDIVAQLNKLQPTDKDIQEKLGKMGFLATMSQNAIGRMTGGADDFQKQAAAAILEERKPQIDALHKALDTINETSAKEQETAAREHQYRLDDMEREFAQHRRNIQLSAFRATAKNAGEIWRAEYDQMLSDFEANRTQMIDSIKHDESLSASEKAHFISMVDSGQAFSAMANARKEDFWRANFLTNVGAGMKLEGIGGDLLGKLGGMQSLLGAGGGESQALKQGVYRLQTEIFGQGIRATLYEMASDKNLDPALKGNIPGLRSSLDALLKSALSPDMVSRATAGQFVPTMLAPASITGGNNFVGYADALRQHMDAEAFDPKSEEANRLQQQMIDLLKKISDLIAQQNQQSGAAPAVISGSNYNY